MYQTRTGSPLPAAAPQQPSKPLCTFCGADDHEDFRVLSRHRTSVGTTVWLRCSCGSLQVRVVSRAGSQIVARGRQAAGETRPAGPTPPTGTGTRAAQHAPRPGSGFARPVAS
jgi:hypothetical protein